MCDNGFTPITPVKFWVQKVLPLVYDDSLSYIEVLSKFGDKLNEVIAIVNYQGDGIYGYIKEQLDIYQKAWQAELQTAMQEMSQQISNNNQIINQRIDTLTNDLNGQLTTFEGTVNQKLEDQSAAIAAMEAKVTRQIATVTALIANTDKANRDWTLQQIDAAIANLPDDLPPVVDPTDGKLESVQIALNHMWDAMRENALTAQEYDDLELTAATYDAYNLTAVAYDRAGKLLLAPNDQPGGESYPLNNTVNTETVRALAEQVRALSEQQTHTTDVLRNAYTLKELRTNA